MPPKAKKASRKRSPSPASGASSLARTIIYVHGIGNKPTRAVLKRQWDTALFGFDLGERSRMAYWVNRDLHGPPDADTEDSDDGSSGFSRLGGMSVQAITAMSAREVVAELLPEDVEAGEAKVLHGIADAIIQHQRELLEPPTSLRPAPGPGPVGARVLPLPRPARDWVTRRVTKQFLRDVYDLFFVPERRNAMRKSLEDELRTATGPVIVIGHSQGSMIAYDVLSRWDHGRHPVSIPLFVTIGAPLGITEVKDQMKKMTGQTKLGFPGNVGHWLNVADRLDPVALDATLAGEYTAPKGKIEDRLVQNPKRPHYHSGVGYLSTNEVRTTVSSQVQLNLFQRISPVVVTRSVDRKLISGSLGERHSILIEVQDRPPTAAQKLLRDSVRQKGGLNLASEPHESLRSAIRETVRELSPEFVDALPEGKTKRGKKDQSLDEAIDLEVLPAYVSAHLTEQEVRLLAARHQGISLYRIFANAVKSMHLRRSLDTVQARTAHLGYGAVGEGVHWAVLDTGIDWNHPHFELHQNIASVWDCIGNGEPSETPMTKTGNNDKVGHGTHVAGIIAGQLEEASGAAARGISGIAPRATLHCYKVLGDDGFGEDIKILKAIHHIYETNRRPGGPKIDGVNLSLGGPFDYDSFGCGDTPLCKELRKLWRQGVVVVVSAGNKGITRGVGMEAYDLTLSSSIEDPANLDESIVVGSVHAGMPNLYGVSYFSSRGPTADGRSKPDVVAPGENIESCASGGRGKAVDKLYRRDSGTSMAAPHVSGLIAAFLSVRSEFKGYPEKVKKLLTTHATDLERERSHQGAGLVNLVKMLIDS
ncbi:MAG TPA: S8 family peptidase [Verrucomicrobiales bacterium]|nr:S8 family peptidase [Verrucomicrobiales bacterium]